MTSFEDTIAAQEAEIKALEAEDREVTKKLNENLKILRKHVAIAKKEHEQKDKLNKIVGNADMIQELIVSTQCLSNLIWTFIF